MRFPRKKCRAASLTMMSSLRKGFMGIKYDKDMADDHDNNEYQK
jgi:hypothetical protein